MHCIWKQDIWHAVFEKGFLFTIVWFVILKLIMLCSENELIFLFNCEGCVYCIQLLMCFTMQKY